MQYSKYVYQYCKYQHRPILIRLCWIFFVSSDVKKFNWFFFYRGVRLWIMTTLGNKWGPNVWIYILWKGTEILILIQCDLATWPTSVFNNSIIVGSRKVVSLSFIAHQNGRSCVHKGDVNSSSKTISIELKVLLPSQT